MGVVAYLISEFNKRSWESGDFGLFFEENLASVQSHLAQLPSQKIVANKQLKNFNDLICRKGKLGHSKWDATVSRTLHINWEKQH